VGYMLQGSSWMILKISLDPRRRGAESEYFEWWMSKGKK
jgi:hypothetical protein